MKKRILGTIVVASLFTFAPVLHAEETTMEKAETVKNKAVDKTKKAYRTAKDEVCELVNGKMECVAKKVKHKAQNLTDDAKTKANEIKNETN